MWRADSVLQVQRRISDVPPEVGSLPVDGTRATVAAVWDASLVVGRVCGVGLEIRDPSAPEVALIVDRARERLRRVVEDFVARHETEAVPVEEEALAVLERAVVDVVIGFVPVA